MSRRLGIAEAPEVTLGAGSRQQSIPVLEDFGGNNTRPGRTTISAMRTYFGGVGVPAPEQIQQFFLESTGDYELAQDAGQAAGTYGPTIALQFQKEADSLVLGDIDHFVLLNGDIHLPFAGTYLVRGEFFCRADYNNFALDFTAQTSNQLAWVKSMNLFIGSSHNRFTETPTFDANQTTDPELYIRLERIFTVGLPLTLSFIPQTYNAGPSAATVGISRWDFVNNHFNTRTRVTLEQLAR